MHVCALVSLSDQSFLIPLLPLQLSKISRLQRKALPLYEACHFVPRKSKHGIFSTDCAMCRAAPRHIIFLLPPCHFCLSCDVTNMSDACVDNTRDTTKV